MAQMIWWIDRALWMLTYLLGLGLCLTAVLHDNELYTTLFTQLHALTCDDSPNVYYVERFITCYEVLNICPKAILVKFRFFGDPPEFLLLRVLLLTKITGLLSMLWGWALQYESGLEGLLSSRFRTAWLWAFRLAYSELIVFAALPYVGEPFGVANGCLISDHGPTEIDMGALSIFTMIFVCAVVATCLLMGMCMLLAKLCCCRKGVPMDWLETYQKAQIAALAVLYLSGAAFVVAVLASGYVWKVSTLFGVIAGCFFAANVARAAVKHVLDHRTVTEGSRLLVPAQPGDGEVPFTGSINEGDGQVPTANGP